MEVYHWLAQWPFQEHAPDLGFIFRLVGLRVGSEQSREVYQRLMDRLALEREHQRLATPGAAEAGTSGQEQSPG